MIDRTYDEKKKEYYRSMYGGGSFTKFNNMVLQSQAVDVLDRNMAKHLKEVADVYCSHGLCFDGMWCTVCAEILFKTKQQQHSAKPPDIIMDAKDLKALYDAPPKSVSTIQQCYEPDKTVTINDPPYQLAPGEQSAASKYTLDFIIAGLPKLTKDQLDELYKMLHTQYDCRIYK